MNSDDEITCAPSNLEQPENVLPPSADIYFKQYDIFMTWCANNNVTEYSEDLFLEYFYEKAQNYKSSTLWSTYSMLKSTFRIRHNIDLSNYRKLLSFIKEQNVGYKPQKSKTFTRQDVKKFLAEAPDQKYLMWKVCLIFGIAGACRMNELKKLSIDDVEDKDSILIITTHDSKTTKRRTFIVLDKICGDINPIVFYRKYISLRPSHTPHKSLFIFYRLGKCTIQPIGIHTFGKIPSLIATYLKLPDAAAYTGHGFRRTSTSLLTDTSSEVINWEPWKNVTPQKKSTTATSSKEPVVPICISDDEDGTITITINT